jgi:hypothetical protein
MEYRDLVLVGVWAPAIIPPGLSGPGGRDGRGGGAASGRVGICALGSDGGAIVCSLLRAELKGGSRVPTGREIRAVRRSARYEAIPRLVSQLRAGYQEIALSDLQNCSFVM